MPYALVSPDASVTWHWPVLHAVHVRPQPPQLLLSVCRSTHAFPHSVRPAAQAQRPLVHVWFAGHAPHVSVPPQPSLIVPHATPCAAHVVGVQAQWFVPSHVLGAV